MAKAEDTEKETWGTWEELLLACAVSRHGTKSWDSVAMEIQNRSSFNPLTAQNCKQKYHDLKRRFMAKDDKIDQGGEESETDDKLDRIPWLDELRKLRVAELKREVQHSDVSIVSLQSKVKRLKEERERSLIEESSEGKPDLEKDEAKDDKKERDEEPEKSSPVSVAGKEPVSGEESDRENQSFNESNSTDPKGENRGTSVEETDKKSEPLEIVDRKPDPVSGDSKPINEGSYIGSSDTIAKDSAAPPVGKSSKANPVRIAGESPELWESVAESKGGGEEGTKESSDVQSSASLSKKKRRRKVVSGSSSGEEPETDEVSPAIKRISVKSQPLISFLEIIRSHKYGSLFERRLESQETVKYRNLIRQHVDIETVRTRLEEGRYSGCSRRFFCDLLLLFNNAIVFFRKNSVESVAATELRELVSKEMASRSRKPDRSPEETTPPPPVPPVPSPPKPEPELEPSDSLHVNPKASVPMIAVRKRSSITAKASSLGLQRKGEQRGAVIEEKPVLDRRQIDNSSPNVEEKSITKKRTKERSTSGARSSRTSSKSRTNTHMNSSQNPSPSSNSGSAGKGGPPDNNSEPKTERKNNTTPAIGKKRSAANFLNRIKRNSPSDGTLLETLKSSVNNSINGKAGGGGGSEPKKSGSGKGDGRKDQVSRQSSTGKQVQSSPAKRSVGRPPKKTAAPPPLRPPAPAKRLRETIETEALVTRQPRKRSRR